MTIRDQLKEHLLAAQVPARLAALDDQREQLKAGEARSWTLRECIEQHQARLRMCSDPEHIRERKRQHEQKIVEALELGVEPPAALTEEIETVTRDLNLLHQAAENHGFNQSFKSMSFSEKVRQIIDGEVYLYAHKHITAKMEELRPFLALLAENSHARPAAMQGPSYVVQTSDVVLRIECRDLPATTMDPIDPRTLI